MSTTYTLTLSEAEVHRFRTGAEDARRREGDAWRAAGIVPGARVADVGCGPAAMTVELARAVGPDGVVDGVDRDPAALDAARRLLADAGAANARIHSGEADATNLEPGAYDAVMVRHVLVHNGPKIPAILAHLTSLLRPGGCLYLLEIDFTGMRDSPPIAPALREQRERFFALLARNGNDIAIGVRLGPLLLDAGLELVEFVAQPATLGRLAARGVRFPEFAARGALLAAGLATPEEGAAWDAAWERYAAETAPQFRFLSFYRAIGRRPA